MRQDTDFYPQKTEKNNKQQDKLHSFGGMCVKK
jgi:hypothetical protein